MEYLDIYDINSNKTGKTIARGDKNLGDNEYIKLATIWLKCKDKYLLQICSEEKGSEYAVTGGHVPAGSTPQDQAIVEAEEELGINLDNSHLKHMGQVILRHAVFETFIYEDDSLDDFEFVLQESEVAGVVWLSQDEIENLPQDILRKSTRAQFDTFIKQQNQDPIISQ